MQRTSLFTGASRRRAEGALEIGYNIIHGSDGPETAVQEIKLFFKPEELSTYALVADQWVYE